MAFAGWLAGLRPMELVWRWLGFITGDRQRFSLHDERVKRDKWRG